MPTYFLDIVDGDDGNLGTSAGSGNAWQHLAYAADQVAAGDKVWVKASNVYETEDGANDCVWEIDTAGTPGSPIVWEGYVATTGDGGIVQVNADPTGDQFANVLLVSVGTATYNVIKGFEFKGASGIGINLGGSDRVTLLNCSTNNNGEDGIDGDDNNRLLNFLTHNNGTTTSHRGIDIDLISELIGVISYGNGGGGIRISCGLIAFSCVYNNGNTQQIELSASGYLNAVLNCTIDGENQASANGINVQVGNYTCRILNNIIHDCSAGIWAANDSSDRNVTWHNLYSSCGANVNIHAPDTDPIHEGGHGDVSDTPDFVNEGADDYSIAAAGNPLAVAFDCQYVTDYWNSYNDGAGDNPPSPA